MPPRQQVVVVILASIMFITVVYLVYKRRLREEYSWLWFLTYAALIIMILRYEILESVTRVLGMAVPVSTLFFLAIIFLMMLCVHFSIRLTDHTTHIKKISQELAILRAELNKEKSNE